MQKTHPRTQRHTSALFSAFLLSVTWIAPAAQCQTSPASPGRVSVINSLKDSRESVREAAVRRLGSAGMHSKNTVPALRVALRDDSPAVRMAAIESLGRLGPAAKSAVPDLVALLSDKTMLVQAGQKRSNGKPFDIADATLDALKSIGPGAHDALPYVVSLLNDKNEFYRRGRILEVLTAIEPDETATAVVIRIIKEEGRLTPTRHQAIRALGKIKPGPVEAIPLLTEIVEDRRDAIASKEADAALLLIEKSAKIDPERSKAIAEFSRKLDPGRSKADRLEAIRDIKKDSADAKAAVPGLITLLSDRDNELSLGALDALSSIGPDAAQAIPYLVQTSVGERATDKRKIAFATITSIDPKGKVVIPLVEQFLADPFKARNAVELLERIGTRESTTLADNTKKRWHIR
jgi:hypothetical protein